MKILAFIALVVVIQVAEGKMACWHCKQGWESQDYCNKSSTQGQCSSDNHICVIRVKNQDGLIGVRKDCQNAVSCWENQDKNGDGCVNGTVSNNGECYYCCDAYNYCNWDRLDYTASTAGLFGSATIVFLVALLTRI